ncbi:probable LRR receptor-like serine/threonine-protein kinase At1g56140 [Hordeum vulgare subsp. vulgare]|uniref:probable LRR receptor-like serine/threonine-protein kinase At1g56140 n=1 Tax=Hordeum vulgare subsp. vulgare TaxID=112509 RepID=UPI00162D0831|nr:probable LRR receptor-like serine/threonine-protein kinase At1g56140 [Hordeum vulgare subsp. vulgare]
MFIFPRDHTWHIWSLQHCTSLLQHYEPNAPAISRSESSRFSRVDLSFNNITCQVPQTLLNLNSLSFLFLGNNSLSGNLPRSIGSSLRNLDFSYNQLSGTVPSWAKDSQLNLNPVTNNFVVDSSSNSLFTLFLSRRTFLRFISSGLGRGLAAFLLKATTGLRS